MSVKIYPEAVQVKGGQIVENKPVQLTDDKTKLQPYSNLFYWAHAKANVTSTIGLHPHQAFEIMSFVLKGTIEHYDTKNKTWMPLNAGDVQIIRAGSGISHAEKMNEGAHIFQIWFDPNIEKTFHKPASYNDYTANAFPVTQQNGFTIKTFKGDNAPIEMDSPGIIIREITFKEGEHALELDSSTINSLYLIEGNVTVDGKSMMAGDFVVLAEEKILNFKANKTGKFFSITTPAKVPYHTYAQRYN
jgi:redox-sensitive bicupin YhaK (pirin superfamily)